MIPPTCRTITLLGSISVARLLVGAPIDGLIFYQGFDHGGRAFCGRGWAYDQDLGEAELVPGRFGRACRFERARRNLLSPHQADIEDGTEGFVSGPAVTLTSAVTDTAFGSQALRAEMPGAGVAWETVPTPVQVKAPHRPAKVFVFSAYLRAERPGVRVRLVLADTGENDDWRAPIETANAALIEKDPKAVKPVFETVHVDFEVTLGTDWQRVAARLEVDARRPAQNLAATLVVTEGGGPVTVWADGLQLEQTCVYPLSNTDPTTWLPGGESRGPAWIDLPLRETGFEGRSGTLSCFVRALPDQCGGTRAMGAIVTLGANWWAPLWQLGGSRWYAGEAPTKQKQGHFPGRTVETALVAPREGDGWHALALAWDENEAVGYLDGVPFARTPLVPGAAAHGAQLRMGGSFLERAAMTGDLDEVALYDRRLSDAEVATLAAANEPLAAALPSMLPRRPERMTFLRSEAEARIVLDPVPYAAQPEQVHIVARLPALALEASFEISPGESAVLPIQPWLAEPGTYPLMVEVTVGRHTFTVTDHVAVFEEPAGREFTVYAWGGSDADLEERGFNSLFGEPRSLLERGLWARVRIDVRNAVPHPWSAQTRARAEIEARRVAREAMAHPNVHACLVNSECSHPPFPSEEPWFLEWLQRETGLERVPPEVRARPVRVVAGEGIDPPPLLPDDYAPFRFLRWWIARGQGYYLLNNQIARWMRAAGLNTVYYSDQPEVPTQFEALDLADFWGYPKSPEGLVAKFSHAECLARLDGKPFQAMPGTVYWDDGYATHNPF